MNIINARQTQRLLYKQAKVVFKRQDLKTINDKLYYLNLIQISECNEMRLNGTFLEAMCDNNKTTDLDTTICFMENGSVYGGTPGMYILQVIKID
jgi:hypothetical protein